MRRSTRLLLPDLADLALLVSRVRADFETALEATLSGYQGVAAEAMRDVMEIEGLLLDFSTHPGNAEEWLKADRRMLIGRYGPAAVRDRLKAADVAPYSNDGFEPVDYQAHSAAILRPKLRLVRHVDPLVELGVGSARVGTVGPVSAGP